MFVALVEWEMETPEEIAWVGEMCSVRPEEREGG